MRDEFKSELLQRTTEVVAAYVSNNTLPVTDLPVLIASVHDALGRISREGTEAPAAPPKPAVPINKSVTPEYLICLEDGKQFKSLRRHLQRRYNLTPEAYRERWGLKPDYPMVAPNYAKARSELAKQMGLGRNKQRD
jgi:predicted transcriptional regulator